MKGLQERLWRWHQRVEASNLDPWLILILITSLFALLYRLSEPEGSLIFDETYYVQMARVILGLPVTTEGLPGEDVQSGLDANSEHPPLAKLIMALGIYVFRDNGVGWRLPSVILGMLGVGLVYSITRMLGGSRGQARLACLVLVFDNLYFVHSRIATLDIYMVSLALLGTWLYLKGNYEFSGIAFALATVCKINGVLGVLAIFLYEGLRWKIATAEEPGRPPSGRGLALMFFFFICFGYAALGAMDCYVTRFPGPANHVLHIFRFGTNLARAAGVGPQGAESTPLVWWLNIKNFDYFTLTTGNQEISKTVIRFQGCMNIYLIGFAPFVLAYNFTRARAGDRLSLLVCCLFLANYVPILVTWIKARRICYLFYMLPSLPAISMGFGAVSKALPGWVAALMVLVTFYSFLTIFPFPIFPWV